MSILQEKKLRSYIPLSYKDSRSKWSIPLGQTHKAKAEMTQTPLAIEQAVCQGRPCKQQGVCSRHHGHHGEDQHGINQFINPPVVDLVQELRVRVLVKMEVLFLPTPWDLRIKWIPWRSQLWVR